MSKELISVFITVFLLACGMSFATPIIPLLLKSINASTADIGQIQTTYFISFTASTFFLGKWIDRAGSKRMILAGLFLFSMAILMMPFAPSPFVFYFIRIIQGIGSALIFAPTEAAINIISAPEKRATNMGIYGLVFGIGFAIGPALGTSLYMINIKIPFVIAAFSCLSAMVIFYFFFHEHLVPISKSKFDFFRLLRFLKVPLTASACYAVVEISIATFLSLYLDTLGFKGAALGIVFTLFALGGVISPFPAGYMADKFGKQAVLKICGIVLVCTTLAFNFFQDYRSICILICLVGLVAGALYPVSLSLIGELVPPEKMGAANASFTFFYGLGSIAGPLATGWVLEFTSIQYLFYPITAAALAFLLVTLFNKKQGSQIY